MPIGNDQDDASQDDTGGRAKRGHGTHDAHIRAELLTRSHLKRDVHADGDEHARSKRLHDASGQKHREALGETAYDRSHHEKRGRHAK